MTNDPDDPDKAWRERARHAVEAMLARVHYDPIGAALAARATEQVYRPAGPDHRAAIDSAWTAAAWEAATLHAPTGHVAVSTGERQRPATPAPAAPCPRAGRRAIVFHD